MIVEVEIENPAEWMERMAIAALRALRASVVLKRVARAFSTEGEPTLGAALDLMAALMAEAERDGKTITLPEENWRGVVAVDYDTARVIAESGRTGHSAPIVYTGRLQPKGAV